MVTWSEIAINLGIILGFTSGMLVGEMRDGMAWRSMFFIGSLLPIIMIFLATCVMVESPRWLVTKGRDEEAIPILRQIYGEGKSKIIPMKYLSMTAQRLHIRIRCNYYSIGDQGCSSSRRVSRKEHWMVCTFRTVPRDSSDATFGHWNCRCSTSCRH
jgi:MFS family permease